MERRASAEAGAARRGWCVLVCPPAPDPGSTPPESLMKTLSRKGLVAGVCRSSFDALAELCVHDRRLRERRTREPMILMVVEPERVPGARELVRAAERYAPRCACWRFAAGATPKLAAYHADEAAPAERGAPAAEAKPAPRPEPEERPRVIVRPKPAGGGPGGGGARGGRTPARGSGRPTLRLAGEGPEGARSTPPAQTERGERGTDVRGIDPDQGVEQIRVRDPRPLDAEPAPASDRGGKGDGATPLLSNEELNILLWDTWYPE